jgi:hypothetical protein
MKDVVWNSRYVNESCARFELLNTCYYTNYVFAVQVFMYIECVVHCPRNEEGYGSSTLNTLILYSCFIIHN